MFRQKQYEVGFEKEGLRIGGPEPDLGPPLPLQLGGPG